MWNIKCLPKSRILYVIVTLGEFGSLLIRQTPTDSTKGELLPAYTNFTETQSHVVSGWEELLQETKKKPTLQEWKEKAVRYYSYVDQPFQILHCSAFPLNREEIRDTTGSNTFVCILILRCWGCICWLHLRGLLQWTFARGDAESGLLCCNNEMQGKWCPRFSSFSTKSSINDNLLNKYVVFLQIKNSAWVQLKRLRWIH